MASDDKDKHRDKHADNMRRLGQAWATPLMIVFSLGALISLGQSSIGLFIHAVQTHTWTAQLITDIAILLIAFVGVVGMDLVLINNAIDMRDLTLRNMPVPKSLRIGTYGIATVEALTFAYVAWQLDNPPSFSVNWALALTIWGFIIMRAVAFPAAAIRLATLGKRPVMLRQILQDHLIVVGDRLATEIQDPTREFTIPQLLEMMVADEEGGNAKSQAEVVAAAQKLITIYEQPQVTPMVPPSPMQITSSSGTWAADDEATASTNVPNSPVTRHDVQQGDLPPLVDRSGVYHAGCSELMKYGLPDGIAQSSEGTMKQVCEWLGVKQSALSEAWAIDYVDNDGVKARQFTHHSFKADSGKYIQVWQVLALYDMGLLADIPDNVKVYASNHRN